MQSFAGVFEFNGDIAPPETLVRFQQLPTEGYFDHCKLGN